MDQTPLQLPDEYYKVAMYDKTPVHVLASIETIAFRSSQLKNKWILASTQWRWPTKILGFLEKGQEDSVRRVTGGSTYDPSRYSEPYYVVIIAPRIGARPIPLHSIYNLVHSILKSKCQSVTSTLECYNGKHGKCIASVGKLLQRPLIEFYGDAKCIENIVEYNVTGEFNEELDKDLLLENSLVRLSNPQWLKNTMPKYQKTWKIQQDSYYVEITASVDQQLLSHFDMYTNMFVYPPAQARLLIEEMIGAVPSRMAGFELVNAWNGLVEYVGIEPSVFKDFILSVFYELENLAGL